MAQICQQNKNVKKMTVFINDSSCDIIEMVSDVTIIF